MPRAFEELGNAVDKAWEQAGRREEDFAEIATRALTESNVLTTVEPDDIISWLLNSGADQLPEQQPDEFGQPPVNLYVGKGFYIQALFWLDSTTAIHEHSFAGAFGVLHGSSVHSTYDFTAMKEVSPRLIVGQVEYQSSELLHKGDIRTILPGDRLIHSLFHLDRPSVSLVVRTAVKEKHLDRPQFAYLKPYLAFYDVNLPPVQVVQLRMLESLFSIDATTFWTTAGHLVEHCDPFILTQILAMAFRKSSDENWPRLLGRIRPEHRELVDYIVPCLKEGNRTNRLLSLRASVHDPTHRFFLALLLNVPEREQIYKLIAQRFPSSDPKGLVLQWLGEIFGEERAGIRITPPALVLIDRILDDPDFENSKLALQEYFRAYPDIDEVTLRDSWSHIQSVELLRPLLVPAAVN